MKVTDSIPERLYFQLTIIELLYKGVLFNFESMHNCLKFLVLLIELMYLLLVGVRIELV